MEPLLRQPTLMPESGILVLTATHKNHQAGKAGKPSSLSKRCQTITTDDGVAKAAPAARMVRWHLESRSKSRVMRNILLKNVDRGVESQG